MIRTKEQIANCRIVLASFIGPCAFLVSDETVDDMMEQLQNRLNQSEPKVEPVAETVVCYACDREFLPQGEGTIRCPHCRAIQ